MTNPAGPNDAIATDAPSARQRARGFAWGLVGVTLFSLTLPVTSRRRS